MPQDSSNGLITPGNIDLYNRPHVTNTDGSVSTVRSIGVNIGGQETLIPTVSEDGRIMSNQEAINQYKMTGKHLGKFNSVDASNAYAAQLHNDYAAGKYDKKMPQQSNKPMATTPSIVDVLGDPDFQALPKEEQVKVLGRLGPGAVPQPAGIQKGDIGLNTPGKDPVDQERTLGVLRSMFPNIRTEKNPKFFPNPDSEGSKVANSESAMTVLPAAIGAGGAMAAGGAPVGATLMGMGISALPFLAKGALQALGGGGAYSLMKKMGWLK